MEELQTSPEYYAWELELLRQTNEHIAEKVKEHSCKYQDAADYILTLLKIRQILHKDL